MTEAIIRARALTKHFSEGPAPVEVLKGVDLDVERGESIAILGSSGSGKSTLLHLLGGLEQATSGEVVVAGENLGGISQLALNRLRNQKLGFVYQFHHLLPEFSALENVAMPLLIGGASVEQAQQRALVCLNQVQLSERTAHRPAEMSGGERQRAAIARALVSKPACVLADEPTGNLDRRNAERALDAMLALREEVGAALVVVTHDRDIADRLDRIVHLVDGRIASS